MKTRLFILYGIMTIIVMSMIVSAQGVAAGNMITQQSRVNGLEEAKIHAPNEAVANQLDVVLGVIKEKHAEQLQRMEKIQIRDVNGTAEIQAKVQSKFLGIFPAKHKVEFTVNRDASLERQKLWHDFLWRDEE